MREMKPYTALIITCDGELRITCMEAFKRPLWSTSFAKDTDEARDLVIKGGFDPHVVLLDIRALKEPGADFSLLFGLLSRLIVLREADSEAPTNWAHIRLSNIKPTVRDIARAIAKTFGLNVDL